MRYSPSTVCRIEYPLSSFSPPNIFENVIGVSDLLLEEAESMEDTNGRTTSITRTDMTTRYLLICITNGAGK